MQNCAIVLGGFETGYMQKLALYLNSRMETQVRIGIVEELKASQLEEAKTVWVGPEKFIEKLRERAASRNFIVLSEDDSGEESGICRYQSCEKLYQEIALRCQKMKCVPFAGVCREKQKWIVMTADVTAAVLLAFSITYTQLLRQKAKVLYLNLSECSGMEYLFCLETGVDLSDLVMALRESPDICLDAYVRQLEQLDYIMPPRNPMILHELREDDVQKLLQAIQHHNRYEYVVLAIGNTCCGCEQFFQMSEFLFHLTEEGVIQENSRCEWNRFIRLCLRERQMEAEQVYVPKIHADSCGIHLLDEWMEGPVGQLAKEYLVKESEKI